VEYVRKGGFPVTLEFFNRMADLFLDPGFRSVSLPETYTTLFFLLSAMSASLPGETARQPVEDFFERAYGSIAPIDEIPDEGLELLLRARASAAIIAVLRFEKVLIREPTPRFRAFIDRLARAAEETADPGLLACHAYCQDMKSADKPGDGFERAVARIPLSRENASLLGLSSLRYREVVDMLMAAGETEEAELYCRIQRNSALAAAFAEKRGDFNGAVKYFREARDLDGALRCARASSDERMLARVHEWRGEHGEALRIWKKLDRKREVARLLKKYPLLRA
jgi:tetratricopeptide (TPR) repeat protein